MKAAVLAVVALPCLSFYFFFVNIYPDGPRVFTGWKEECDCQWERVCGCWEAPVHESTRAGMGYPPWVESADRFNVHNLALLAGVPGAFVWGMWVLQLCKRVVGQNRPVPSAGVADTEEGERPGDSVVGRVK